MPPCLDRIHVSPYPQSMAHAKKNKLKEKLTAMQARFCELLVTDKEENATKAYRESGYKAKGKAIETGASRLLRNAKVAAYVQHLRDQRSKRTNLDADWVFKKLEKLTEICMSAIPVMIKVDGVLVESGQYKVDSFGANKSIETIAKCLGMFKDKGENPFELNIYTLLGGNNGDKSDSELDAEFKKKSVVIGSGNGRPVNRL